MVVVLRTASFEITLILIGKYIWVLIIYFTFTVFDTDSETEKSPVALAVHVVVPDETVRHSWRTAGRGCSHR